MTETRQSITAWADETFGEPFSNMSIVNRADSEMDELCTKLFSNDAHPGAAEELADVFIVLYRLAAKLGVDLHEEIDRKMAVNRQREWKLDGNGHGQHVKVAP